MSETIKVNLSNIVIFITILRNTASSQHGHKYNLQRIVNKASLATLRNCMSIPIRPLSGISFLQIRLAENIIFPADIRLSRILQSEQKPAKIRLKQTNICKIRLAEGKFG